MREHVIYLAENVVIDKETRDLEEMLHDLEKAKESKCHCPACQKQPESIRDRIQKEFDRTEPEERRHGIRD